MSAGGLGKRERGGGGKGGEGGVGERGGERGEEGQFGALSRNSCYTIVHQLKPHKE